MPNIKSAIKRAKTNEEARAYNATIKSDMRTAVKKVEAAILENNAEAAKEYYSIASKKLEKAASKGIIHKNTAARKKSRLAQQINALNA